jgi:hypothetical protein
MRTTRRAQTTVEYMLTISVITIAVMAVVYTLMSVVYSETGNLGQSMATSLTTDGIQ